VLEHVPGRAAQHQLAHPRAAVATHDQEVGGKRVGFGKQGVVVGDVLVQQGNLAQALDSRGDPQRALEALLVATEHRPQSKRQARMYGMRFTDYVPYFWIAREHARLGNWECALDALRMSEQTGEVTERDPEFSEFRALVEDAKRKVVP